MQKDYKNWTELKIKVNNKDHNMFFHERDILSCHFGENIGFEQDGKGKDLLRPGLILKKFNNEIAWIIPLTSNYKKKNSKYYFEFTIEGENEKSILILSQLKLIDVKRMKYKIGNINKEDFVKVKEKIKQLLA